MEEFFTFGNPPGRTSWLDLTYVYRSIEGRRAGVVLSPAIYLGPTYLYRMAGTNVGTFGAPDRNHHGLGGVAGLSLDLRWTHAYFGLDFSGRYAFGVASPDVRSDTVYFVLLRAGVTFQRRPSSALPPAQQN